MTTPFNNAAPFQYLDAAQALHNIGDAGALRDMLQMLRDLLDQDLELISRGMEAGDFPAASRLLHSLKGCMPIFCIPALCEELTAVEHASKSQAPQTSLSAYRALRPKLEALRQEIVLELGRT